MMKKFLNFIILIMSAFAILELAMSQVHIKTITNLFTAEVGFFLFLFIILGIVTLFNLTSIKKNNNEIMLSLSAIGAILAGIKYISILLKDYKTYDNITFSTISFSLYLTIAAMFAYGIGTIMIIILKKKVKTK